ncbi:MAG: hypothetical protein K2J70_02320 [Muribaculaceae bacterium]|nr:hypothetical protein [Muribaculaceae bacterium]
MEMNDSHSHFSPARVVSFGAYWLPRVKPQLLIYAGASLLCALLCLIPAHETVQVGLFVMVWTLLPILFYCGPLIFAKGPDTRIFERLLPVSAAEKLTFFYLYSLIAVPIAVFLLPWLGYLLYLKLPSIGTPGLTHMYELKFHTFGWVTLINLLGAALTSAACLYAVETARNSRIMWGIAAIVISNFFVGLLGAIYGAAAVFKAGFIDGLEGRPSRADARTITDLTSDLLNGMETTTAWNIAISSILAAALIVVVILTYRTLKNRNL